MPLVLDCKKLLVDFKKYNINHDFQEANKVIA